MLRLSKKQRVKKQKKKEYAGCWQPKGLILGAKLKINKMKIKYQLKKIVENVTLAIFAPLFVKQIDKYFEVSMLGLENFTTKPAILVPNHSICVDGPIFKAKIYEKTGRNVHVLVDEGVYNSRKLWQKMLLWAPGDIPVRGDRRSTMDIVYRRIGEYVNWSGELISIFSEGLSEKLVMPDGSLKPIEERTHMGGAGRLATFYNIPIIPVGIKTAEELEKVSGRYGMKNKKEGITFLEDYIAQNGKIPYIISFGKEIFPEQTTNKDSNKKQRCNNLTKRIEREVVKLVKEIRF